ncbi:MAG: ribonucleoside triphosphate reductase, partial [Thermoflexales bacterium]|nr:ribonucleoside triphosphate reductase [Thermoflexales bacterium]
CGWDLQDLLLRGFGGVPAKIESRPPKHLRSALGQVVNFFYTLQGETAGAQAFSNLDTLLAPFVRYDHLPYEGVKQAVQEFVFNINVPTRVGFQSLVWDEWVLVKQAGRIQAVEIGCLVDEQFRRNAHRILTQGNDSFAVSNADDVQALAFGRDGRAVWAPVNAFVRHRVPARSSFACVRTSRGTARVSQAHSLFAFEALNGDFNLRPMAASAVDLAHGNAALTPTNHFVAIRQAPNGGTRGELDLVELIDAVPQVAERARVRLPDHAQAVNRLQQRVLERFGGMTPFYLEYGIKDKGCWQQWSGEGGTLPYRVWRTLGDDEPAAEFALRNSDLWYARHLAGKRLKELVRLLGWYITEGHNDISNGLYVSQARGDNQAEITRVLSALGALGRIEELPGWSARGNPTQAVLRMAGKGLLAVLISYLGGTYSTHKTIPWFVYDLTPALQQVLIATLLRGDAAEYSDHFDYTTTSKRLSLGLSLLLAMNGYKFSVYETTYEQENWNDQYILRVYKDKLAAERYAVGDLAARVCTQRESFTYTGEYEYDLSVDVDMENFAGGSGLLCFHNTPFTNITMDLTPSPTLRDTAVIVGGEYRDDVYGDFQAEMDMINRAFAEVMVEGDAKNRVFTFPIPTYNITADFDWDNPVLEPVWEMTAKYGIPYFANFVSSDLRPEDARSMCCRLRLDNRELRKRGGGLFGANPLTGSVGVVTINMPRLGYLASGESDFFARLAHVMDLARMSLEVKRKSLERLTMDGLYPYSRYYLAGVAQRFQAYWANHFSTIGLNGMNECCLNFLGVGIEHPDGHDFAHRTLEFMRERLVRYQEETGDLFNLEATPAEGASYRLAKADKARWPDIRTAGTDQTPYYTNSTHLPVNATDDLFQVLRHQDALQTLYTGGTVLHIFLGEQVEDWRQARLLVRRIAENFHLPYYTLTPTFSICPVHGYIAGEHTYCPYPHSDQDLKRFGVGA